jgi:hypothetical protein
VDADRQPARFLRMLPVENPDQALPLGGRIQITGVEIYDTRVGIAYRLAPLPNIEPVIREKLAGYEKETEGLPPGERQRLRMSFEYRLNRSAEPGLTLSDDIGTEYHSTMSNGGGGSDERVGRTQFEPAVPDSATKLFVRWGEVSFTVRLS